MYEREEKELKKSTRVMTNTFTKQNLKVLNYTYRAEGDGNADCTLYVEIASIGKKGLYDEQLEFDLSADGGIDSGFAKEIDVDDYVPLENSVIVIVNLYDAEGEILVSEDKEIYPKQFDGYDTLTFYFELDEKALLLAKTARIYAKKGFC